MPPNFKSVRTESLRYPARKQEGITYKWTLQGQKQHFLIPNSLFLHPLDFKAAATQELDQLDQVGRAPADFQQEDGNSLWNCVVAERSRFVDLLEVVYNINDTPLCPFGCISWSRTIAILQRNFSKPAFKHMCLSFCERPKNRQEGCVRVYWVVSFLVAWLIRMSRGCEGCVLVGVLWWHSCCWF